VFLWQSSQSTAHLSLLVRLWAVASMVLGMALLLGPAIWAQDATPQVRLLTIDGTITPPMAQYVERGIRSAENDGVAAVILEIDTPGGLSSAMDDIDRAILESDVPVIAWVAPRGARAASAGVFITYAAHIAAMAPGTSIGSASPVSADGSDMTDTMQAKVTNDAVSTIRNLAEFRGRNADWAEQAVREAVNITADEALDLNVINLIAADVDTLLREVDGMQVTMASGDVVTLVTANAEVETTSMNLIERFLQLISEPTIAYLLLSFGALGIFLELSNPGGFVPGIVGALCLILGLFALGTLPVNWAGIALIALAFVLFVIDLFVTSFGILLVGGLAAFIVGSYLLVDGSVPGYDGVSPVVIWTSAALIAASALFIGGAVLKSMRSKPVTGESSMIGDLAEVRRPLDPTGMVFMHGEHWTATRDGDGPAIPVGATVRVTAIHGLRLIVEPAPDVEWVGDPLAPPTPSADDVLPVVGGVRYVTSTHPDGKTTG
jgi:membrane-bound serine protease (ClpP class)